MVLDLSKPVTMDLPTQLMEAHTMVTTHTLGLLGADQLIMVNPMVTLIMGVVEEQIGVILTMVALVVATVIVGVIKKLSVCFKSWMVD